MITTVNIQHLESIADAVEQMTGAQVQERVPDWVVRKADQIELVDSSPEALRRRMLHGNIYPQAKVPQALTHFFRTDNLIALRELALRFLADETEDELLEHLRRHQTQVLWETSERILVAVTAAPGTDAIVRRAARMAARIKADLHVAPRRRRRWRAPITRPASWPSCASWPPIVGADWNEIQADDPARAIIDFARDHQITQIVVGSSSRSRWQELKGGGSIVRKISRLAGAAGIDVHIIARRTASRRGGAAILRTRGVMTGRVGRWRRVSDQPDIDPGHRTRRRRGAGPTTQARSCTSSTGTSGSRRRSCDATEPRSSSASRLR